MADTKAVQDVKSLEEKLAAARESARAGLIQTLEDTLSQLRAIGFDYDYVTHEAAPKQRLGRPRKEKENGVVQPAKA